MVLYPEVSLQAPVFNARPAACGAILRPVVHLGSEGSEVPTRAFDGMPPWSHTGCQTSSSRSTQVPSNSPLEVVQAEVRRAIKVR